ncbi:MAG: SUMF1/EgtB/PvdO family nonheme iron enzyme [Gammaproteobacteria bacterium]|nr:SUMF1/EgtB/PvdO family nonheme iron enzyme [Gammaproteobacteria bacterium]
MKYGLAALILGGLIALLAAVTRFTAPALNADTVAVELGFTASSTARAAAVDEALLSALERGHVGDELRHRLNRPPHTATLERFWADACEVRQIDFERFARRHNANSAATTTVDATTAGAPARPPIFSSSSGHRIAGLLQSPASGVDFPAAAAYCRAAGGRLPWAEEWEALAAGAAGRLYPWGDTFTAAPWPYQDSHRNAAQPCATHPGAASPDGVHDLANNAMEWSRGARDVFAWSRRPRPGAHGAPAVRGAARELYALAFSWLEIPPHTRSHHLGFRCVYDRPPPPALPWGALTQAVEIPPGDYPQGAPPDLRLARVATLLPANQQRQARRLVGGGTGRGENQTRIRVSRCEVSRRDYRAFLNHPLVKFGLFANEHEPRAQDYTPRDWARQLEAPDLPVTGVDWWAADAFARWAGGRLPGVEEWQLAAAGRAANRYPWGDDFDAAAAATGSRPQPAGPEPCGAAARDITAAGVRDLAGNVSEWTRSVTAEGGDYAAWVQGGNYLLPGRPTARSVFGRPVPLGHRSPSIGLRVVYD